jgi:hypothetical protein
MSDLSSAIYKHRILPSSTETRRLVAFLRPICKQKAQPPHRTEAGIEAGQHAAEVAYGSGLM